MEMLFTDYTFGKLLKFVPHWTWQEIRFAYCEGLITYADVVLYANEVLVKDMIGFEFVLNIVISKWYEDINGDLDSLICFEKKQKPKDITDKWLYALLSFVYDNQRMFDNALEIVAILYADFGYPDDVAAFVYYMPPQVPGANLFDLWQQYLALNAVKYFG